VNKDYTQLWDWIRESVPLPDDLPYGEPLIAADVPVESGVVRRRTAAIFSQTSRPLC